MTRYLSAEKMVADDFGVPFMMVEGEFVYDAQTKSGQWATMGELSWSTFGGGRLGLGLGQKYRRNAEGHLVKVEG